MAVIGGIEAPFGRVMGHAGAWCAPGEHSSKEKIKILEDAGVVIVNHPEKFGPGMKTLLDGARPHPSAAVSLAQSSCVLTNRSSGHEWPQSTQGLSRDATATETNRSICQTDAG